MKQSLKAFKISDHVYWVGAIDWNLKDFHGYATQRGTSYNAYLIMADKITLIDTVKKPFFKEMISRISSIVDPKKIKYVISNHSEMDHSGSLPETIELIKPEKVFASVKGVEALNEHFHMKATITEVKDGERLSLGNMDLSFVETRMVHWPDSMFTYLPKDEILFSNDAFGMHLASNERFADECDSKTIEHETKKYYANILMPLSQIILKTLEKFKNLNLPLKVIATDHGPIWRKDFDKIIRSYSDWALKKPSKKAVIVYDTMWQSTNKMAHSIADGIKKAGADPVLMYLKANHRSDVVTEMLDAGAIIVGSPTINNNIFPTVADVLTYLKGLKPQKLIGAAFGSYGWSGEAFKQLKDVLSAMKVEVVHDGINAKYVPDEKVLEDCFGMGKVIGEKLLSTCKGADR